VIVAEVADPAVAVDAAGEVADRVVLEQAGEGFQVAGVGGPPYVALLQQTSHCRSTLAFSLYHFGQRYSKKHRA